MSGGPQTICRTCDGDGKVPVWLYADPLGVVDHVKQQTEKDAELGVFVRELHASPEYARMPLMRDRRIAEKIAEQEKP